MGDDLGLATPVQTWTTFENVPVPGADSRMRSNLWIHDSNIAAETSVRFKSIRWEPLPTCGIDLVENARRKATRKHGGQLERVPLDGINAADLGLLHRSD